VLEALLHLRGIGMQVSDDTLVRGFEAYKRFFEADGGARLGPSPSSPLDAHSAAQGMVTYAALHHSGAVSIPERGRAAAMVTRIAGWALSSLWLPSEGFFAYRIQGRRRDEREFTRWVQAWLALGMATSGAIDEGFASDASLQAMVAT
jgi:hypothetical protein